jgi:hypothetical protein
VRQKCGARDDGKYDLADTHVRQQLRIATNCKILLAGSFRLPSGNSSERACHCTTNADFVEDLRRTPSSNTVVE